MTDYFLNFPDAASFESVKGSDPFEYREGGIAESPGWAVDIIGEGVTRPVSWNAEGEATYETLEGFLVNLRSNFELPDYLEEFRVYPSSPVRVWA